MNNGHYAVFKTAVCQRCREEHRIEKDDEIWKLKCKKCGNTADLIIKGQMVEF